MLLCDLSSLCSCLSQASYHISPLVCSLVLFVVIFFFFQAEDGIRDLVRSRGLGDVYKRQLIPLVMILVLTVGLVGLVSAPAALSLGILPKLVLTPIVWIIENLAALSFSSAQLKFSLLGMISIYLLLVSFVVVTNSSATHQLSLIHI